MLSDKDKRIIQQIIKHSDRIEEKILDKSLGDFENDVDLREIVCFNIFQIGELAKRLSDSFIKEYNKVPWKEIKGMRDRIGHGYDSIDNEIVYYTAVESIEELKKYCKKIIKKA